MQLSWAIIQIFWAKPGNPRMERGRGGWEGGREGERERKAGREGRGRAKPGNQLVYYIHIAKWNQSREGL